MAEDHKVPVLDLFSYRKRVAEGKTPDVFAYDKLPQKLRVQIIHIWRDAIGKFHEYSGYMVGSRIENNQGWVLIHNAVAREHGVFKLADGFKIDDLCATYLLNSTSIEAALDLIEVSFRYIDEIARDFNTDHRQSLGITLAANDAIDELNERFLRAGVGYRFEEGMIIRIDSELVHSEVVRPALRYLHKRGFEGPRDEFMRAHAHYRSGEIKDAISDANNAFESTLKAICDQRHWKYPSGARASDLLKIVRKQGLLPSYLDNSFDQLAATLKSGLPKVRGEEGAHGQGATPRETPAYVAAYALHLAAAQILFLVDAHMAMD